MSKFFDRVDYKIFLKIKFCGITGDSLKWFQSCLSNINQPSQIDITENTEFESVKCGVTQGSILGLLLLYVNDLKYSSHLLEPRIFFSQTIK